METTQTTTGHRVRMGIGYLLTVALLAGVLSQVPWAGLEAAVGGEIESYDQAALAGQDAAPDGRAAVLVGDAAAMTAPPRPARPLTLSVAGWKQEFGVVDVARRPDGALVPPDDVATLGRWDGGALPGEGSGAVVLVVHRDSAEQGRGPFARLEQLRVGSRVAVGGVDYRLTDVATYPKGELPARQVFGQQCPERLVIVTRGGSYSTVRGWDSNVVATFQPLS